MRYLVATITALAAMTGVAVADVTFDPSTGMGSVGRGDIQTKFGPEAVTPEGAETVGYFMRQAAWYTVECRKQGVVPARKRVFEGRRRVMTWFVSSVVDTNPHGNVTGWDLEGFSSTQERGRWCPLGWRPTKTAPVLERTNKKRLIADFDDQLKVIWRE